VFRDFAFPSSSTYVYILCPIYTPNWIVAIAGSNSVVIPASLLCLSATAANSCLKLLLHD